MSAHLVSLQDQSKKYVRRLRQFEQISGAALERLKVDWEEDPVGMDSCVDADVCIWEIFDRRMGVWVSVYLLANVCHCGLDVHVCHHILLARHCAACGNNPANSQHTTSRQLQQQAVLAAQRQQACGSSSQVQDEEDICKLFKVS